MLSYPEMSNAKISLLSHVCACVCVKVSPKETHITIDPSDSVSVGTNVTLTCKSKGSPSKEMNYTWYKRGQEMLITQEKKIRFILNYNNTGLYFCRAQNKHGNQSSAEIPLTAEGEFTQSKCKKTSSFAYLKQWRSFEIQHYGPITVISHDTAQDGHSMTVIAGCVGGIVAVLMLSVFGFCTRYLVTFSYIYSYLIIVNVILKQLVLR